MTAPATSAPALERPPVAAPPAAQATPAAPAVPAGARRPEGGDVDGRMLPRQSARCLRYIAEHPGASATAVRAGIEIRHASQISRVLHRLERDGLAHTQRQAGAPHAWELTETGAALLAALPEGLYE